MRLPYLPPVMADHGRRGDDGNAAPEYQVAAEKVWHEMFLVDRFVEGANQVVSILGIRCGPQYILANFEVVHN